MATFDDVGARVICGGLHPDHSTVAGFVRRREQELGAAAGVGEGVRAGGPGQLEVVAGDGTKLKAAPSMAANLTREQLDAQVAELEEIIAAEFALGGAAPGR